MSAFGPVGVASGNLEYDLGPVGGGFVLGADGPVGAFGGGLDLREDFPCGGGVSITGINAGAAGLNFPRLVCSSRDGDEEAEWLN